MYKIVYTKTAAKDIPKLKAAHLADKAKALIDIIRDDPFQKPPPYENWSVIWAERTDAASIYSTGWSIKSMRKKRPSRS